MKSKQRLVMLAAPIAASGTLFPATIVKADGTKPWSVKFGVNRPRDSNVRGVTGNSGFHLGVGYNLPTKGFILGKTANSNVEFVYNQNEGNGSKVNYGALFYNEQIDFGIGTGGHFYAGIGVGIARLNSKVTGPQGFGFEGAEDLRKGRFQPGGQSSSSGGQSSSAGGQSSSSGGQSQGAEQVQVGSLAQASGVGPRVAPAGTPITTESETKYAAAGKATFGYAWQNGFFTEATYTVSGTTQGAKVGGFTLGIGMHF